MEPLHSAWSKIARAKKHLDDINGELKRFDDNRPYSITPNDDGEFGAEFLLEKQQEVSETVGLMVGDFASNLRESLDHIINELVDPNLWLKLGVRRKPQFPIFDRRKTYRRDAERMLTGVPRGVRTLVEKFQPYHARQWPETHILTNLQDLSNTHKHRLVLAIESSLYVGFVDDAGTGHRSFRVEGLNERDQAKLLIGSRVLERAAKDQLHSMFTGVVFIEFEERDGTLTNIPSFFLDSIYDFVTLEVVPRFTRFAKQPDWMQRGASHYNPTSASASFTVTQTSPVPPPGGYPPGLLSIH